METVTSSKKIKMLDGSPSQEAQMISLTSLESLPEELIDMIFSLLNDPKDLISVSNSASTFSRILEPSKTTFMFGEVFQLLFPKLEKQDILNCRLVCQQWNGFVDNFLQNGLATRHLSPFPNDHFTNNKTSSCDTRLQSAILRNHPLHALQYQPVLLNKNLRPLMFSNPTTLTKFLNEIDNHPRNPFVLRLISDMSHHVRRRHLLDYWHRISTQLLPKFGTELLLLQICPIISHGGRPYHDEINFYYKNLQNALKHCPNLKSLILYGPSARFLNPNLTQITTVSLGYQAMNPLPPLPQLETLSDYMGNPATQGPVMDEIIRSYSKQLKTLSLGLSIWKSSIAQYSSLPRCTSLYIHLDDNAEKWECLCRQLEAPNLGKLALSIQQNFGMTKIFKALQQPKFQSVVYLTLNFIEKIIEKEPAHPYTLENAKSLEVLDNRYVPYDQLLKYLPRLEYMLVCYEGKEDDRKNHDSWDDEDDRIFEIRKWMLSGSMYKSNIWKKMEFLKEFVFGRMGTTRNTEFEVVSTVQYTREIYNRLSVQEMKVPMTEMGNRRKEN